MSDERYERGLATLRALRGADGPHGLLDLGAVAPDLARFAIEAFGDLYGDATLDPKTRELATVAALTWDLVRILQSGWGMNEHAPDGITAADCTATPLAVHVLARVLQERALQERVTRLGRSTSQP